ncbi:hypothetical protein BCR37DRAFT_359566 [Protomyces lactucae-debilis]|uniref:Calcineurin-like phosphoesterase domain-containing protein n=1 Tax=Protomyces lactucae-debilis TaxID=2754530 RepID=A0A1Y2FCC1_PROLT|nr:uncharacterized protein BCR37DRAFT_359566 [Protomyces lactucae-debilis]ORY80505.1 hypothetical protein BCR37DRAFT_359566 [Protomyces lactucae-debilis]
MADKLAKIIAVIVVLLNVFLYCYPVLRGASYLSPFGRPPIRVLILTDPHLEGDSKIARMGWRGALDIWGNDHYLGHIHRVTAFFARPTQTVVLGDHLSSQWIDDAEFRRRAKRMEARFLRFKPSDVVFNISGNHDIGYAGEMTRHRLNRWHDKFGPSNYVYTLPSTELPDGADPVRFVGINDLHLDGPAEDEPSREQTHAFLQTLPNDAAATILLAHVPLYKDLGLCVDEPRMEYYQFPRVLLKAQNHLSPESTAALLDRAIGHAGGIVLTGHDHEGCHTFHSKARDGQGTWFGSKWNAQAFATAKTLNEQVVEEVTVRSVMGQYHGNVGLLTARWDSEGRRWTFKYQAIPFVHNTVWWIIKIVSFIVPLTLGALHLGRRTVRGRQAEQGLKRWVSVKSRLRKTRDY